MSIHVIPMFEEPNGATASLSIPTVRDPSAAGPAIERAVAACARARGSNLRIHIYDDLADRTVAIVRPRTKELAQ